MPGLRILGVRLRAGSRLLQKGASRGALRALGSETFCAFCCSLRREGALARPEARGYRAGTQ